MFIVHSNDNLTTLDGHLILVVSEDFTSNLKASLPLTVAENIIKTLEVAKFKGKSEEKITLYTPQGFVATGLTIISVGDEKASYNALEDAGGTVAKDLYRSGYKQVSLSFIAHNGTFSTDKKLAFLIGFHLRCYQFDAYRTTLKDEEKPSLEMVHVFDGDQENLSNLYADMLPVIEGIFTARDLVAEPSNILYPESYAQKCIELEKLGLTVTVLDEEQMAEHGMFCLLGVGQGSVKESKTVILEWQGAKDKNQAPLALVGKGVCFDSGGISLKPGAKMWDMIFDMGGSAAVVGAMIAFAGRKASANIVGIIGLVENMPDGNAQRPGDVVKTMSGQTVEVQNTDAEGRLVLADIMWYVQEKYKPCAMIDLATLTGAIIMALGYEYAGLFSNNDELAQKLLHAGTASGDKLWRFPMGENYNKRLKSRVADMANIASSPEGGSITAACFLERFVKKDVPWAHLDIAGTAWTYDDKPTNPKGGTGFGVRLLDRLVRDHYEDKI